MKIIPSDLCAEDYLIMLVSNVVTEQELSDLLCDEQMLDLELVIMEQIGSRVAGGINLVHWNLSLTLH